MLTPSNLSVNSSEAVTKSSSPYYLMSTYIEPLLTVYFASIIYRIYRKAKYNLEPIHMFVLNILVDMVAQAGVKTFENGYSYVTPDCQLRPCKFIYLLQYFSVFSFHNDVILEQVDGFLALYWNVKYKTKVTMRRAAHTIMVSKTMSFLAAYIITKYDPEATRCKNTDSIACQYLKKNNIFYLTIPMVLTVLIIIMVSGYFICVNYRANKVSPYNKNLRNLEVAQQQQHQQQRVEKDDVTHFNDFSNDAPVSFIPLEDVVIEDLEIKENPDEDPALNNNNSNMVDNIQRQSQDPYMFYRVKEGAMKRFPEDMQMEANAWGEEEANSKTRASEGQRPMLARDILKINLIVLFLILMMLPWNIFNVIFYFTDSYDCEQMTDLFRIFGFVQLLFVIFYPVLNLAKLKLI